MPILTATGVGHRFGALLLFRDLSFTLAAGQTLAITGANGSGKSTLIRILAGVLTPRAGRVVLHREGRVVERARHPQHVGLVAPYLNVYDGLTARENLAFLAAARGLSEPQQRIDAALHTVGLAGRADAQVATYSSGMKQRVKYAAALLPKPLVLLLDEPSANFDAAGRALVEQVTAAQHARGGALVVATNRPEEAATAHRVLRIEDHR
ncbi:heme ABC exporter ATP-binding protein CcmA [Salisaeta longa]|uniref:heme ABC exporter ATP-binding protein CcmA n=1 Tax=Salisaeta longa TaxID=503170 RepID=UPI00040E1D53|nr:heme ABC exporter ATP-binding protein CcmA [Salisaeta longa]